MTAAQGKQAFISRWELTKEDQSSATCTVGVYLSEEKARDELIYSAQDHCAISVDDNTLLDVNEQLVEKRVAVWRFNKNTTVLSITPARLYED